MKAVTSASSALSTGRISATHSAAQPGEPATISTGSPLGTGGLPADFAALVAQMFGGAGRGATPDTPVPAVPESPDEAPDKTKTGNRATKGREQDSNPPAAAWLNVQAATPIVPAAAKSAPTTPKGEVEPALAGGGKSSSVEPNDADTGWALTNPKPGASRFGSPPTVQAPKGDAEMVSNPPKAARSAEPSPAPPSDRLPTNAPASTQAAAKPPTAEAPAPAPSSPQPMAPLFSLIRTAETAATPSASPNDATSANPATPLAPVAGATTKSTSGNNQTALPANVTVTAPAQSPGSAPQVNPVQRTPADQIADQVRGQVSQLQQTGRMQVQVDLHPPELGRVQVHLALENGRVNVHMVVQDDAARQTIGQQLGPLRVRFSEMGVNVGQFDVRREGSSANSEQQPNAERSAQPLQAASKTAAQAQNAYGSSGSARSLVDVIA